ncbi:MAG TPA: hypothetical protein VFB04_17790 [Terriglobales bacterium]|nr:hypothetical protein [Terriglobales bacterium]
MALIKNMPAGGKKQAPMPGPNSAAYKKIVAAKKAANSASKAANGTKKTSRPAAAFSSLKSRQMLVERIKRAIWASCLEINDAIISLAKAGNCGAAKALFDFAGVYSLPAPEGENAKLAPIPITAAQPGADAAAVDPMDAFFRSIGMPAAAEPELSGVGAGL